MGYAGGEMVELSQFGYAGTGPIWLDDFTCNGDEKSLADCKSNLWGASACTHSQDVALKCHKGIYKPINSTGW